MSGWFSCFQRTDLHTVTFCSASDLPSKGVKLVLFHTQWQKWKLVASLLTQRRLDGWATAMKKSRGWVIWNVSVLHCGSDSLGSVKVLLSNGVRKRPQWIPRLFSVKLPKNVELLANKGACQRRGPAAVFRSNDILGKGSMTTRTATTTTWFIRLSTSQKQHGLKIEFALSSGRDFQFLGLFKTLLTKRLDAVVQEATIVQTTIQLLRKRRCLKQPNR